MIELISKKVAIDTAIEAVDAWDGGYNLDREGYICKAFEALPSTQPDIDEFLRNKSPKEHREILHWIAIHYYPRDSKEVLQAVSNMIRPDTNGGSDD